MNVRSRSNIRTWGEYDTEAFFGPVGLTLPEKLGVPEGDFVSTGWLGEDSISNELAVEIEKFRAAQAGTVVRTKVVSSDRTIKVQFMEENPNVTAMYDGHGTPELVTASSGDLARVDYPKSVPTVERSGVMRFLDEKGIEKLLCYELLQATDRGEIVHKNSEVTIREITWESLGDVYMLTNQHSYLEAARAAS